MKNTNKFNIPVIDYDDYHYYPNTIDHHNYIYKYFPDNPIKTISKSRIIEVDDLNEPIVYGIDLYIKTKPNKI